MNPLLVDIQIARLVGLECADITGKLLDTLMNCFYVSFETFFGFD